MKVILTEDVKGLGKMGDVVRVKDGYARNYLLPRQLAVPADEKNLKALEHAQRIIEAKKRKAVRTAESLKQRIEELSLTIKRKAGQEEKLFGSVTTADIEEALKNEGINVSRKDILMDEPIKKLGYYTLRVRLAPEIEAELKVWIVQE